MDPTHGDQLLPISLSVSGVLISAIGTWIAVSLQKLTLSVQELNERMAVVIEKVNSHERRLERLERKGK